MLQRLPADFQQQTLLRVKAFGFAMPGEVRTFDIPGGAGFYDDAKWSPDGEKISFSDNSWAIFVLDVASGKVREIGRELLYGPFKTVHHAWSPDSRWIAYTLTTKTNFRRAHPRSWPR